MIQVKKAYRGIPFFGSFLCFSFGSHLTAGGIQKLFLLKMDDRGKWHRANKDFGVWMEAEK